MRKLLSVVAMLCIAITALHAQQRTITGKVIDDKGAAVAGASIVAVGTTEGTTTGSDGSFSLSVANTVKQVLVSALNFAPKTITIGNNTTFEVSLVPETSVLDEVVVTGYQQVSKRSLTGSIAKVAGEEIADKPVLSFDQSLAGKAAGVYVNTSSGLVGDNVIIRVRGAASISSGSQPLIVLDGIPINQGNAGQLYNPSNALADINPNDIASVEVLKDASASAIYGSRASAGVILITTKKGKAGTSKINYDMYVGFNEPSRRIGKLNAADYTTVINKMRSNAGLSDVAKYGDINGDGTLDVVDTDWENEVYRNGFVQQHQISASGGGNRANYYASVNYNDFQNYIINNRQERVTARINSSAKAADWLTIGINSQYGRTKSFGLGSGTGGAASGIPLGPLLYFPNVPVYDAEGDFYLGQGGNTFGMGVIPNPVAVLTANFDNRDAERFLGSGFAEVEFMPSLKFKTQINVDYQTAFTDQFWNPEVGDGSGLAGVAQNVYDETRIWSWFNTLNYKTRIGDNHSIDVLAGTEYTKSSGLFYYGFGIGVNDPSFTYLSPSNYGTTGAELGGFDGANYGLASYFGQVSYSFKDRYFFTGNFRADAYSGFGRDNRFGYFPSGSVGWRISDENFMQNVRAITDMKLRASYGITGNSNIGTFPAISSFSPTLYADIPALTLNNPGNSSLRWEQTAQLDIGLDLQLFNRVNFVFDYYKKNTEDLILNNPILATIGFPGNTILQNIGKLETTGFEASINGDVVRTKNFNWNANFNFAWNKNMVIETNDNGDDLFGGFGIARPNTALGTYFLINWAGVNPDNGWGTWNTIDGTRIQFNPSVPAAQRWTTVDGGRPASAITAADREVQEGKTPYPKYFGGFTNTFNFFNFDLVVDLQYAFDFWVYNSTLAAQSTYTNQRNKTDKLLTAWQNPGDNTNFTRLYWNDNQHSQASTRWLERGDFVRIRNTQLGYTLPRSVIEKWKMSSLRFYVQVQNLYTFTDYQGIDPESNANGNANIGLGIDNNRPYLPRTFTAGIQLSL